MLPWTRGGRKEPIRKWAYTLWNIFYSIRPSRKVNIKREASFPSLVNRNDEISKIFKVGPPSFNGPYPLLSPHHHTTIHQSKILNAPKKTKKINKQFTIISCNKTIVAFLIITREYIWAEQIIYHHMPYPPSAVPSSSIISELPPNIIHLIEM